MKIRKDELANYRGVFFNGKTIRMRIDSSRPITVPSYPEIEDVAINSKCFANCSYCYTSATKSGSNFEDIVKKAQDVWGSLSDNQRPFQIAIGGAGESTIHPHWIQFVTAVKELGIMPNYTTNGMHLSEEILRATEEVCGGVALSYHPHLGKIFDAGIEKLSDIKTRLNLHIIVGEPGSLESLQNIYDTYRDKIEYFVILPYQAAGRGKPVDTSEVWRKTMEWVATVEKEKFAFGALFYEWLLKNETSLEISIYEPEIYSGYRIMDDSYKILRKSSYDLRQK